MNKPLFNITDKTYSEEFKTERDKILSELRSAENRRIVKVMSRVHLLHLLLVLLDNKEITAETRHLMTFLVYYQIPMLQSGYVKPVIIVNSHTYEQLKSSCEPSFTAFPPTDKPKTKRKKK